MSEQSVRSLKLALIVGLIASSFAFAPALSGEDRAYAQVKSDSHGNAAGNGNSGGNSRGRNIDALMNSSDPRAAASRDFTVASANYELAREAVASAQTSYDQASVSFLALGLGTDASEARDTLTARIDALDPTAEDYDQQLAALQKQVPVVDTLYEQWNALQTAGETATEAREKLKAIKPHMRSVFSHWLVLHTIPIPLQR